MTEIQRETDFKELTLVITETAKPEIYKADQQAGWSLKRSWCCSLKAEFLLWEASVFAFKAFN